MLALLDNHQQTIPVSTTNRKLFRWAAGSCGAHLLLLERVNKAASQMIKDDHEGTALTLPPA